MLSVVVIGKNEADNLPRLAASIDALIDFCDFPVETIFVDSDSADESVGFAKSRFSKVIPLADSGGLCASAGRYVGSIEAVFPWILYLDGDMEICPQFFPVINNLPAADDECKGFVGFYVHNYDNGSIAVQGFFGNVIKSNWAAQFGGAVVLRRSDVLRVGNWNPSIYGKEEMELYARLGNGKRVVQYIGVPMVNHYSEYFTRFELLKRLLYPGGGQGKVFYGFGQSIRSLFIQGKMGALVRLDFEPFVFFSVLILGLIGALFLPISWGVLLVVSLMLCLSVSMRPGPVIRYLTLPIPLVLGFSKYIPYFRPEIKSWSWISKKSN